MLQRVIELIHHEIQVMILSDASGFFTVSMGFFARLLCVGINYQVITCLITTVIIEYAIHSSRIGLIYAWFMKIGLTPANLTDLSTN